MQYELKSKMGRSFWRFGVNLSPDGWSKPMELSAAQLRQIEQSCTLPVGKGGALEIRPNPFGVGNAEDLPAPAVVSPPPPMPPGVSSSFELGGDDMDDDDQDEQPFSPPLPSAARATVTVRKARK